MHEYFTTEMGRFHNITKDCITPYNDHQNLGRKIKQDKPRCNVGNLWQKQAYKWEKCASNIALWHKTHFKMLNRLAMRISYRQYSNSIKCI